MSYIVLARKYRPQSFDEVLGQRSTVTTLSNAIGNNRLHQAYLFCGARGVGKTSLARIFAKSVNCETGLTVTPCQKCTSCVAITQGNGFDVLEIDGASNTSVDDVRELREQAKYLPTSRYKIYIIDEVHMLSTSAFNALLKILEEPPPHLMFVFATTEPHKIPITILSRCQRFDLKKMTNDELKGHLSSLLGKEGKTLDDESLNLIARCGEGSVRDSLSLLDQILSFCGDTPSPEKVREVLGLTDKVVVFDVMMALVDENIETLLEKADGLFNKGADLKLFSEELLRLIRDLIVMSESKSGRFVDQSNTDLEHMKNILAKTGTEKLLILFDLILRGAEEMARSDFPKLVFETLMVKAAKSNSILLLPQILEKLNQNPGGRVVSAAPAQATAAPVRQMQSASPVRSAPPVSAQNISRPQPAVTSATVSSSPEGWNKFVKSVLTTKPQVGAVLEHARPLTISDEELILGFEPKSLYADMLKDRIELVSEMATQFFGSKKRIVISSIDSVASKPTNALEIRLDAEKKQEAEITARALSDPFVKMAQESLGATVKEVKTFR